MPSWKNVNPEHVLGALVVLFLVLLILRSTPVEGAKGFYIVRPTYWKATPTTFTVELTSFYPTNLVCEVDVLGQRRTIQLDPRSSTTLDMNASFRPGTYVRIPVRLDCGEVKEEGVINTFVFTT